MTLPTSEEPLSIGSREELPEAIQEYLKSISEQEEDIRVAVIGTIIELDNSINSIMIDDGEAALRIILPEELFERCEPGKMVRVIGLIAPALDGDEIELRGEIVQDFSGLDRNLYIEYLKKENL